MSHEILYSRAFVKTSGGIIPMIQAGSSNCTEFHKGKEVLERSWFVFDDSMIDLAPEDIMPIAYSNYSEKGDYFLWRGKWVTDIPAWMQSGIRSAGTIEQYRLTNPDLYLKCWFDTEEEITNDNGYARISHCEVLITYCRTTADLDCWLERARQYLAGPHPKARIRFDFGQWEPVKAALISNKPVVVKRGRQYLSTYENSERCRSTTWVTDNAQAMVFDSAETARALIGDIKNISFVSASNKAIEKPFALYVESGPYCGSWIRRVTARNMSFTYYSENAELRFKSEKDAQKYVLEKLLPRFGNRVGTCVPRRYKEENRRP